MLIYSVNMCENALEETEIVLGVLDIDDSLFVQGLGRLYEGPRTDRRSEGTETYRETLHRVETPPLPTDKKLAT